MALNYLQRTKLLNELMNKLNSAGYDSVETLRYDSFRRVMFDLLVLSYLPAEARPDELLIQGIDFNAVVGNELGDTMLWESTDISNIQSIMPKEWEFFHIPIYSVNFTTYPMDADFVSCIMGDDCMCEDGIAEYLNDVDCRLTIEEHIGPTSHVKYLEDMLYNYGGGVACDEGYNASTNVLMVFNSPFLRKVIRAIENSPKKHLIKKSKLYKSFEEALSDNMGLPALAGCHSNLLLDDTHCMYVSLNGGPDYEGASFFTMVSYFYMWHLSEFGRELVSRYHLDI